MKEENQEETPEEKLQKKLREIFQFEHAELDFGIYRIMNMRRKDIEKFIDKELIEEINRALEEYSVSNKERIERELKEIEEEIKRNLGKDAILPNGKIKQEYADVPLGKRYTEKVAELDNIEMNEERKGVVFSHILEFFSRYYDKGDFISKRRRSKGEKYAIPYNGEEVVLYWATKDQYYIKTTEYFNNYTFDAGEWKIHFRLRQAEAEVNNNKSEKNRYFIIAKEDTFEKDDEKKEFTIYFEYREMTEEEKNNWGDSQDKLNKKAVEKIMNYAKDGLRDALNIKEKKGDKEYTKLEINLMKYTTKNKMDYFIHKNLGNFLRQELDFYIKNEVLNVDEIENMSDNDLKRLIAEVKVIKRVSHKIIDFLEQIEEFQKKLWEKKKFVVRSDYCITLDRIPEEFYDEILANEEQIEEWKRIYNLEEFEKKHNPIGFSVDGLKIDKGYLKSHPYMMLDTKFFDEDFKYRLLATFDNLDEETDGLLIKSENWQALNLLQEKYREKIKTIYIDPPYNTENDRKTGKFLFKDGFTESSWLSMIENRLTLSKNFINDNSALFTSIDDNEIDRLSLLIEGINFEYRRILPTIMNLKGNNDEFAFAGAHEYTMVFSKKKSEGMISHLDIDEEEVMKKWEIDEYGYFKKGANLKATGVDGAREKRPNLFYPIFITPENEIYVTEDDKLPPEREGKGDIILYPRTDGKDMSWRWSKEKVKAEPYNILVVRNGENISLYKKQRPSLEDLPTKKPKSILYRPEYSSGNGTQQMKSIFGYKIEGLTVKPLDLIKDLIYISSKKDSLILDFFAGSGTTGHAVINLNREDGGRRKYILVEMGDYFDTVLKPRIQKVVFSNNWKNGVPQDADGISHMFKYMYLEQYEDTLNNIELKRAGGIQTKLEEMKDYMLRYMLEYESRGSKSLLNIENMRTPFEYTMRIVEKGEIKDNVLIDLVETFNYLIGLHVEKIRTYKYEDNLYKIVIGHDSHDEDEKIIVIWRNTKDIDLKKDKEFIEKNILNGEEYSKIYVNGPCYVEGAEPIEPVFKEKMGV